MTTTIINRFPQAIQDDIRETLKVWRSVYVFRENGAYRTSIGIALTGQQNADDYRSWHVLSTDIYSDSEITDNNRNAPDLSW